MTSLPDLAMQRPLLIERSSIWPVANPTLPFQRTAFRFGVRVISPVRVIWLFERSCAPVGSQALFRQCCMHAPLQSTVRPSFFPETVVLETTLLTRPLAAGWDYVADDLTGLDQSGRLVCPFPVAISLKLERSRPHLVSVHERRLAVILPRRVRLALSRSLPPRRVNPSPCSNAVLPAL